MSTTLTDFQLEDSVSFPVMETPTLEMGGTTDSIEFDSIAIDSLSDLPSSGSGATTDNDTGTGAATGTTTATSTGTGSGSATLVDTGTGAHPQARPALVRARPALARARPAQPPAPIPARPPRSWLVQQQGRRN
jgi:hypothetical protein